MNERHKAGLEKIIPGRISFDCPMDEMTTYRVGGKAEAVCFPGDEAELSQVISFLYREGIPCIVVGKGSNLLVSDEGIKGAVVVLRDKLASVDKMDAEGGLILAGGGLKISSLLTYCSRHGLSGLEFMAGIPGTLGGAILMNAGALGQEISNVVQEVLIIRDNGEPCVLNSRDMKFSYRRSSVPEGAVIYGAKLRLLKGDRDDIAESIANNLRQRKETQPLNYPSAGSVFKNPPDDYAGRLIEKAGLKGTRIGGAMISEKHGNFIVNTGGAKAADIKALMDLARTRVKEETGIVLEPEIVILGE